ncbi:MAG: HIT family protein [Nocardioidaceae bacterium]
MAADCVFCDLIASNSAPWVTKEEQAVAFFPLPGSAIAPGHTLVVPRWHGEAGVLDVPPTDLAATVALVQRVSQAMMSKLGAGGVCVLNASGPESGRSIDHLHFHVVPRYAGDGDDCLPWPTGKSPHQPAADPRHLLAEALR